MIDKIKARIYWAGEVENKRTEKGEEYKAREYKAKEVCESSRIIPQSFRFKLFGKKMEILNIGIGDVVEGSLFNTLKTFTNKDNSEAEVNTLEFRDVVIVSRANGKAPETSDEPF